MAIGQIRFSPFVDKCGIPDCPYCIAWEQNAPKGPLSVSDILKLISTTKPDTGPVVDFSNTDLLPPDDEPSYDVLCDCNDCDYCNERPLSNTERVTDLEIEVQNLRAAVLDLTKVVEYLLIWTGRKGNKQDRDKYLDGYIDPIRVIL